MRLVHLVHAVHTCTTCTGCTGSFAASLVDISDRGSKRLEGPLATALGTYTALTNRPADAHLVLVIAQPDRDSNYEKREADVQKRLDGARSVVETPLTATIMREKVLDALDRTDFKVLLPERLGWA